MAGERKKTPLLKVHARLQTTYGTRPLTKTHGRIPAGKPPFRISPGMMPDVPNFFREDLSRKLFLSGCGIARITQHWRMPWREGEAMRHVHFHAIAKHGAEKAFKPRPRKTPIKGIENFGYFHA